MKTIQTLITDHLDIWTAADTAKKSGRGRSSGNAASVYGIKKLRELILELAVRGKLVPQDPKDEPASELLKRIQAGTIKKIKLQLEMNDQKKPFKLPKGWEWVNFGSVSEIERGGSPRPIKSFFTNDADGVNWIKIGDTDQGGKYITSTNEKIKKEGLSKTRMVYPGDFLLTNSMSFGRPYITKIEGCIHDGWLRITPPEALDKDFLYYLLSSSYVRKVFIAAAAGAVVMNLNADKVRDVLIPVPPLAEQHRIVAKVDELMALCDQLETKHSNAAEAHEKLFSHLLGTLTLSQSAEDFSANWQRIAAHFDTLFTTEASIDALKQTLLQLAVMGKLVPQDANDEPASELLKSIQAEKAKLIAEGKIKKDKSLSTITEVEKPFDLPQAWKWIRLDEISQVGTGATPLRTKPEYFNPAEFSWITSGETSSPYVFATEQYVSSLALKETNLTVYPKGTLVVAMYGQGKTRGQITELMVDACTNQACAAIRLFNADKLHRKYVKYFFEKIYDEIRELAAGGAQPNLNLSKIKETLLPLPPLSEQQRIVAKVDELMAICDQLKSRITKSNQLQQKLADVMVEQTIL